MAELVPSLATPAGWLPLVFMVIMGASMLAYVVLDGFDLGIGILLALGNDAEKNVMVAAIGPFWDANETWLVLGVGVLLVAFPLAHGLVLTALYFPVSAMLIGLTLRGVAFDFRVKARDEHRAWWNRAFFGGSLLAAFAQGFMLGQLVLGFEHSTFAVLFSCFIGLCLASGYALVGACWLIAKTTASLQLKAIRWAKRSMLLAAVGLASVSVATPLLSSSVFGKWFTLENLIAVWPIPLTTIVIFATLWRSLSRLPVRLSQKNEYGVWIPFACCVALFFLAFHGIAYSLFPYIVVDELTIWQAASAPESLLVILAGTVIVLPMIVGYSFFAYWVFRGKAVPLEYY